jgi:hypothetical protein
MCAVGGVARLCPGGLYVLVHRSNHCLGEAHCAELGGHAGEVLGAFVPLQM